MYIKKTLLLSFYLSYIQFSSYLHILHSELARQYFGEAARLEWIAKNPFLYQHGGSCPNTSKMLYLSPADCKRVIQETVNVEHAAIIALWRFCGLRGAKEFCALEWSTRCIRWGADGKAGSITVYSSKTERYGVEHESIPNYWRGIPSK